MPDNESSANEHSENDVDSESGKHLCDCGCELLVDDQTERRHWRLRRQGKAIASRTGSVFVPPANAQPALQRGGRQYATRRGSSSASSDSSMSSASSPGPETGPIHADSHDTDHSQPSYTQPDDDVEPDGAVDSDSDTNDEPRPSLRQYSDAQRRKMQPSIVDISDDDEEPGSGESDASSESSFWSDEESVHGDDLFADANDDGLSAWEKLNEDFVREIAKLDETYGLSNDDLRVLREFAFKTENEILRKTYGNMSKYFPELELGSHATNRSRMSFLSTIGENPETLPEPGGHFRDLHLSNHIANLHPAW
ncbi:hypothetical protein EXIGLDRAFT_832154 [Exidia glandulosa HHB12029]|uniref:Uncharacterized protein n=1 Tax=Exidia glandulosa HHB12029 TaxID=1314781 RepID=A0A165LXB1_EXIGL|nr:hypothetical protein EXIGLDRAFT_832154 [Exidia glandulosa HHB12029]